MENVFSLFPSDINFAEVKVGSFTRWAANWDKTTFVPVEKPKGIQAGR